MTTLLQKNTYFTQFDSALESKNLIFIILCVLDARVRCTRNFYQLLQS